jgi:hypothetical protein
MSNEQIVIPKGQVDKMVEPVVENTRHIAAGAVSFAVEFRELNARVINETYGHDPEAMKFFENMMDIDDVGVTVHVYSRDDMIERLRFDAFGDHPHYHYVFPDGSHKKIDYDVAACGDLLEWSLRTMEDRLPEMLRQADASHVADQIDLADIRAVIPTIVDTASRLLSEKTEDRPQ